MKTILSLALFFCAFNAFAVLTTPYSNSFDATGTITFKDKIFMQVKGPSSAKAAGTVLVLDATKDDGATATTSTDPAMQALCVLDEYCAASAMCRCQVWGYSDVVLFDAATTATANYPGYLSDGNAGYVEAYASDAGTYQTVGSFLDASAASGAVEFFIRLL